MSDQVAEAPLALSLRDRFLAFRDRMVSSPRFRAWAARFPLTRPLARRRARALFDLNAGFVYSQILTACVRLRVFDALREGPRSIAYLAVKLSLSTEATLRLMEAAAALDLVEARGGGRYGLGSLGAALVDNAGVVAMVEHHAMLYADLADPVALLRSPRGGTKLAAYWAYAGNDGAASLDLGAVGEYSALMAASQPMIAAEILGAYPLARHRCLMDVGGGEGAFLSAAGHSAPKLSLMLFDLPAVAERARARLAAEGLADRATTHGGSFHTDALPEGADVISLVRVVHDHDDDAAAGILARAHAALPQGGTLLLAEPMSGTPGAEPIGEAYFGFYLLAMGRGRPRRMEELQHMLATAGFSTSRPVRTRTPMLTSLLVATK
ncbi:methyltransferase [Roseococcus suduntuyensis]|uniref:Demethylspheroidene O-methyltransferase n=1 Tax=Roseococcus suduntuyensis TaxID=455361 RepID=A0A840AFH7_9PROT|nr:methyltransferase [Roseococcus suduntuyensis]MBB3898855.1 demethylspheroidene O-methyltransferase [Roseococcus suduntuyensis]